MILKRIWLAGGVCLRHACMPCLLHVKNLNMVVLQNEHELNPTHIVALLNRWKSGWKNLNYSKLNHIQFTIT